jgi:HlyD family secretion protein
MKANILKKKGILLIIIVLIAGVGIYYFGKPKTVKMVRKVVPNVKVQKISLESMSTEVQYASKLEANQVVTVSSKTSGKIATVNVKVGDKVKAGQVLFTLDTSDLKAQLQEQQAALDAANANLSKTSGTSVTQAMQTSEQQIAKDQITYNNAKDNYDKMQQLYNAGAIAKQNLDDANTSLDTASLQLNSDKDNLNLQKGQIGPEAVQAASAQVEQSQAAVNYAQTQINDSSITSPIDGIVSAEVADVGSVTSATVTLGNEGTITIIDSSTLIPQISVPDKAIGRLKVGEAVLVAVSSLGDKNITGVIDNISPDADPKTNSYTVKVKIDNSNGDLLSGMFVKISLPDQKKDNVLTVPNEAISIENGIDYIYTVDTSKIKKVIVATGISNDKITEVTGNVKEGTEIITEGQNLLSDGENVKVVK